MPLELIQGLPTPPSSLPIGLAPTSWWRNRPPNPTLTPIIRPTFPPRRCVVGTVYDYSQAALGNYYFTTALHELGHAFGLSTARRPAASPMSRCRPPMTIDSPS